MTKADIYSFLHAQIHAVVATADKGGKPESALIGFGETQNLEIIFGTSSLSRKYQNLKTNPQVALVISWEDKLQAVQYEGIAHELSRDERDAYLSQYEAKVPSAAHYKDLPDQTYFLIKPIWIRYSDLGGDKPVIEEFKF